MSTVPEKRRYTVAEYLAMERESQTKHEFYRGEIFAMAGATIRHNEISGNIFGFLHAALRGKGCRPYHTDQRVTVQRLGLYTYPDTAVVCGPIERDDEDSEAIKNPRVIFEVLSKSTEAYDRGRKFQFYQQLDSLREYVLVSQVEPAVTRFVRQDDGTWLMTFYSGLEQTLDLSAVDCSIPLSEIFDGVDFNLVANDSEAG